MKKRFHLLYLLPILVFLMLPPVLAREAPIAYHLSWDQPNTHYFHIRMDIPNADGQDVQVRIPAWRPGRYILQDFAKHIIDFEATDGAGSALKFQKTDKSTWHIEAGGAQTVTVRYKSYARLLDAGNSYLDDTIASINPITLLMYIPGKEQAPVTLSLDKPADWKVATALDYDEQRGLYPSEDYHELVDSPLFISPDFEVLSFDHAGARFELVLQGKSNYDPDKVLGDVRRIVETQIEIMDDVPFERYVFLYNLLDRPMGHGVEHKNSTVIVSGPANFDNARFYNGFLSVTSHEFFHVWNAERIRPEAIYHPDYSEEQYTSTMWIYEGITSYYTSLTLARAGLRSAQQYLNQMAGIFKRYDDTPGRSVTSVAMTSWDSWTKSNGAPPNTYYSFYTAGNVLGFLLDLEVRGRTKNKKSLDDVFRYLYKTYAEKDRGVPENGLEMALEEVTGSSFQPFFDAYVYGTEPIDYNKFLNHAGLTLFDGEDRSRPRVSFGASVGGDGEEAKIRSLTPNGSAMNAGLFIDDVLVALDGERITRDNLTTLLKAYEPGDEATLSYFRRDQLHTVQVRLEGGGNARYGIKRVENPTDTQEKIRKDWLNTE